MNKLTNKEYLSVTVPFMLSTMTQPLMGAVNTAVMGTLPDPSYIAGVALGVILFNNLYWMFGFLRVSTSGFSAQALGSNDKMKKFLSFYRPLFIAIVVAFIFVILQKPITGGYLNFMNPENKVRDVYTEYCNILIWGAPFVLINYVSLGWLMGQIKIRASLFMQISTNVLNIILSVLFVLHLELGVKGVAWATLCSQFYGFLIGVYLMRIYGDFEHKIAAYKKIFDVHELWNMIKINVNLMLRCACLLTTNNIFAGAGVALGTVYFAANSVLQQIQYMMSYLLDGMANGASIFSGKAVGEKNKDFFYDTIKMNFKWMCILVIILCSVCGLGLARFITWFSDIPEVVNMATEYGYYLLLYPILGGVGLTLYGIFTGATQTAPIRDMMAISLGIFFLLERFFVSWWGNHGLWIAYLSFIFSQSVLLFIFLKRLNRGIKLG